MIWGLLALHLAGCAILTLAAPVLGRRGLLVGAIPPAVTAIWAFGQVGTNSVQTADLVWVEQLDLGFVFRVDSFAAMMTLLVSGIGALVFVYAYGYFSPTASDVGRFAAALLSFSTAMLGLVWADSVWTLFIFWELTSVTSFLLVGHKRHRSAGRSATPPAGPSYITGVGGLVLLLAGLVVLGNADSGTTNLTELSADGQPRVDHLAHGGRRADHGRRRHQVGPVPLPRLAPRRHGRPHARSAPTSTPPPW